MLRKLLASMLCASFAFTFVGCGNESAPTDTTTPTEEAAPADETKTDEAAPAETPAAEEPKAEEAKPEG